MKNIITISFSILFFFISCKTRNSSKNNVVEIKVEEQKNASEAITNKKTKEVVKISITKDTLESYLIYTLKIKNSLCSRKYTILKHPLKESLFHNLELDDNNLFYEYESARPVYYKTIYFDETLQTIDSIEIGNFNQEKSDYDIKIDKTIINVCNQKLDKLLY